MFNNIRILVSWLGVLGISSLVSSPAYSQTFPNNINRGNTSLSQPRLNKPTILIKPAPQNLYGTASSYPYGSQVNELGWISTPTGQVFYPSVGSPNGDGTTTYYYPNGARITIDKTKLPASGRVLR